MNTLALRDAIGQLCEVHRKKEALLLELLGLCLTELKHPRHKQELIKTLEQLLSERNHATH